MREQVIVEFPSFRHGHLVAGYDCAVYLLEYETERLLKDVRRVDVCIEATSVLSAEVTFARVSSDHRGISFEYKVYDVAEVRIRDTQARGRGCTLVDSVRARLRSAHRSVLVPLAQLVIRFWNSFPYVGDS